MIRTCDLCLRRAALYPLSYGRGEGKSNGWRKTGIRSRGFRPRKIPEGGRFAAAALFFHTRLALQAQDRNLAGARPESARADSGRAKSLKAAASRPRRSSFTPASLCRRKTGIWLAQDRNPLARIPAAQNP
jgi:hypothetical protein